MKSFIFIISLVAGGAACAQSGLPELASLDEGWNTIATDGVCSAGTPYQFYVRPSADNSDVLVYFNGGGACWFGEACDLNAEPNVHSPFADMQQNNPALADGIFAYDNPKNPLANHAAVFIPYCNGDVHMGGTVRNYQYQNPAGETVEVTTYHTGYANSQTALQWVYENFPAPTSVVVSGSSAGAIGSSFFSGLVAEHYPDTPVVLIADAAGGYGSPNLPVVHEAWDTASVLPDWAEYEGESNQTLTFEDFYIASALRNPNLTIAQYNAAEDEVQKNFTYLIGDPPGTFSLPQRILNNYQKIESAVDSFYTYTAGGSTHTILRSDYFYDYSVEGVRFVDWVNELINGHSVPDISCVNLPEGCGVAPQ